MIRKQLIFILLTSIIVIPLVISDGIMNETGDGDNGLIKFVLNETEAITLNPVVYDPDDEVLKYYFTYSFDNYGVCQYIYYVAYM